VSAVPSPTAGAPARLRRGKKFVFAFLAVSTLLALVEGGARLAHGWTRPWVDCHRWHALLGWSLREGWSGDRSWTGGPARINAQGIRDDEAVGPRLPGEKRLLILGDSITFGARVRTEQAYPQQLQQALAGDAGTRRWRVLNGGVTSYDPGQEADWLELFGLSLQPDVLAVAFCHNDLAPSNRQQQGTDSRLSTLSRWLTEHSLVVFKTERCLQRVTQCLAGKRSPAAAVRDEAERIEGWPLVERSYRRIASLASQHQLPVVLFIFPTLDHLQEQAEDDLVPKLKHLAAELGWSAIDLAPAFRPEAQTLFLAGDPVHPSAAGYARAAEYLSRELQQRQLLP
jgi:lysophospholipase L1-like esterase